MSISKENKNYNTVYMQSDIKWEFVDCGNDKGMLEAWKSVTGNQLKVGLFLIYVPRKHLMVINVYKCLYRKWKNPETVIHSAL